MKNKLLTVIEAIVSLIINFILFESLSWYHFKDIPTTPVVIRFIIFLFAIFIFVKGIFNKFLKNSRYYE